MTIDEAVDLVIYASAENVFNSSIPKGCINVLNMGCIITLKITRNPHTYNQALLPKAPKKYRIRYNTGAPINTVKKYPLILSVKKVLIVV